jgi:tetratricopeptide (TPR) repeat protein
MHSSLDTPDDESWRSLRDYSYAVARRLTSAYARIALSHDPLEKYQRALVDVEPCVDWKMSDAQRLRVSYVEALCTSGLGAMAQSLDWTDAAVELAIELDDRSAVATLLYLRGANNASWLRYAEACDDYADSRMLLRSVGSEDHPADARTELHLTTTMAILRFFLGQYDKTEHLLDEARSLLPHVAHGGTEAATIPWVEAHLFRWRGEPERALRPALAAAQVYGEAGNTGSIVRIQTVTTDVMLDLAAAMPTGTDRAAMLAMAEPHLMDAIDLAARTGDEHGAVLARLTEVRFRRMRGDKLDRLRALEWLANEARHLHDDALLAQAFTGLGDEWTARKERMAALSCYRQSLAVLDGSDIPAVGVWARRALYQADQDSAQQM